MSAFSPFLRALALTMALLLFSLPPILLPDAPTAINGGYYLSVETELSPWQVPDDPNRHHIALAYNTIHQQYLAVWHTTYVTGGRTREVIGQRLDSQGKLIGGNFVISTGTGDRLQPAVVYNATDDEYLVIWMHDSLGDGQKYNLWGARFAWNGAAVGAPFQIISVTNRSFWSPEVAWNHAANEYLVIWGTLAQDTQNATDIGMKILDHHGGDIYATIITGDGYPANPDLIWDPVNLRYLVVWNYLNTSGKLVVGGDLRDSLGNRIRLVDIYGSTTQHALFPRVASSMGLFFMVTFELENSATDHDIWVAYVSSDATVSVPAALVSGAENDTHPDIAGSSNAFEYLVDYQRAGVMGAQVRMVPINNTMPVASIDLCNYVFTDCLEPALVYGGRSYLNAYIIDVSSALAGEQPTTPITRRHVFSRPFHSQVIYLPIMNK